LFHAGREALDQAVALFIEPDLIEHIGRALTRRPPRQTAHLGHVGHEISRRRAQR
jgi:hypothetical protein